MLIEKPTITTALCILTAYKLMYDNEVVRAILYTTKLPKYVFKTLSVNCFGHVTTQCCAAQNNTV